MRQPGPISAPASMTAVACTSAVGSIAMGSQPFALASSSDRIIAANTASAQSVSPTRASPRNFQNLAAARGSS